jgi:hypothetical protein
MSTTTTLPDHLNARIAQEPERGFGRLWRREFRTVLGDPDPAQVVELWRVRFDDIWPAAGRFAPRRVRPGQTAPIEVGAPEVPGAPAVQTAVEVVHSGEREFAFATPQGHMFAGVIVFSADRGSASRNGQHRDMQGAGTIARVSMRIRPNDPLYEAAWPLMRLMEGRFWRRTLQNLAQEYAAEGRVDEELELLDGGRIWSHWRNIRHNAAIGSLARWAATPLRRGRAVMGGGR